LSLLTIAICGALTLALRGGFFFASGATPPTLQALLRFVPSSVLPALAVSATLSSVEDTGERVLAALTGLYLAWRFRNAGLTMLLGMVTLWCLLALN